MNNKLVSIIIPTYSRPIALERAIDSVLNQTYKNIEVIIVDDNNPETDSRIETEKLMKKYENNNLVKYIKHKKNKNGSAARNTGWKSSKGEYLTFLDDDDFIAVDRVEKMVKNLENLDDSWGMCYSKYKIINKNNKTIISTQSKEGYCYINALMRTLYMGSGSNLFLRRKVVEEINGYDESFLRNQDLEFLCRASKKYKISHVDDVLLTVYRNDSERKFRSLEEMEKVDSHYIDTFKEDIYSLSLQQQKRVMNVIYLERFRYAMTIKEYKKAFKIITENHVDFKYFFSYVCYLLKRIITHSSYGYEGLKKDIIHEGAYNEKGKR